MRVLTVSHSDDGGGAAIAARRLHYALRGIGVASTMVVLEKRTDCPSITAPVEGACLWRRMARTIENHIPRLQKTPDFGPWSVGLVDSGLGDAINAMDADIVHLSWINAGCLSVREIARLNKPVVWTTHDMWAICGAEHYNDPSSPPRYKLGYCRENRPDGAAYADLDRLIWRRKRRLWSDLDMDIVCTSRWMEQCTRESVLFGGKRIHRIMDPLDLEVFRPRPGQRARFGLPPDKDLLLFGVRGGTGNKRKGYVYLDRAIEMLKGHPCMSDVAFVILGEDVPDRLHGHRVYGLPQIRDEAEMARLYAACDGLVLPTMRDNLPNNVKEAAACGTATVGFDTGGMRDMIRHRETGYLADTGSAEDLAEGVVWLLTQKSPARSERIRAEAKVLFDEKARGEDYRALYVTVLSRVAEKANG